MLSSTRRAIVYPNPTRADTADVPRDFLAVVNALEVDVVYGQGTLAARPAFGLQGRIYCASDQTPKQFYWDNGTGWDSIGALTVSSINQIGLLTNRPLANAVVSGTKYFATDQVVEYISDGITWTRLGDPAGATVDWFHDSVIPTGWVAYDATALPSSVGIYADLATHLGGTATPDTRGRSTVGKGTHVDVDHVLDNDGVAIGLRRPRHKHTLADPGHTHATGPTAAMRSYRTDISTINTSIGMSGAADSQTAVLTIAAAATGITVGPQTGNEPTDSSGYITAVKIAKL